MKDDNLHDLFRTIGANILQKVDDVITEGSGLVLSKINELLVQVNRYDPLNGSSYIKLLLD